MKTKTRDNIITAVLAAVTIVCLLAAFKTDQANEYLKIIYE